ncbi:hypothetical protein GGR51DRAFT_162761 [Nemania sp. FL0031]|nr:hypothetical protein GGR51DRAFT_162761 [Nemania sp. FL0031]
MSLFARNYVPLGLAILFGIANGYYAFQPMLLEQHQKKSELQSGNVQQPGSASNDTTSK